MKNTVFAVALWLAASAVPMHPQNSGTDDAVPAVLSFVAPAYPRAARDQRKMGTTVTRITVTKEGHVSAVQTVSANPVFEKYVLDALKQWRFKPSAQEHTFEVTCQFEFYEEDCDKPLTPETQVSAELPSRVTIRTGLQCIVVSNSGTRR